MQIYWWCYTADFWTHFYFDYSLAQQAASLQIRLNYTASNIVNAQPRNSRIHACELRKKWLFLPRSCQKTWSFILACVLPFRKTKSIIAESWTAWQWANNAADLATAVKLDLNWETNKTHLREVTHGNNRVWHHLLSNQWHKTLLSRLLGMYIRFKLLCPLALCALGCHGLNHPS